MDGGRKGRQAGGRAGGREGGKDLGYDAVNTVALELVFAHGHHVEGRFGHCLCSCVYSVLRHTVYSVSLHRALERAHT
jgi:hypothetical protein